MDFDEALYKVGRNKRWKEQLHQEDAWEKQYKEKMTDTVEILCEDENGAFWWKLCQRDGCQHGVTHDDDNFCYPHSRWWRPAMRYVNMLITFLEG